MQSDFLYLVENELADMRERHQDSIAGPQIAYRVITQIALSRTFRYHTSQFFDGSEAKEPEKAELLKELVQIAAMCYRAAEDLQLLEVVPIGPDSHLNVIKTSELKPLNIIDDRTLEQKAADGDIQPDEAFCGVSYCKHSWHAHGITGMCKVPRCSCWQFVRLDVLIASQR